MTAILKNSIPPVVPKPFSLQIPAESVSSLYKVDPKEAFKVNARNGLVIESKNQISVDEIEKIQAIVGSWLQVIFAREALKDEVINPRDFKEYITVKKPLVDEWDTEMQYHLFLEATKRLTDAEASRRHLWENYGVTSIRFTHEGKLDERRKLL